MMEAEISPERRERIDSVLDEILSVPRLIEANLTQRSLSNPRQMRKYLGGSERLSESGSRLGTMRSSHISGSRGLANKCLAVKCLRGKYLAGKFLATKYLAVEWQGGNYPEADQLKGRTASPQTSCCCLAEKPLQGKGQQQQLTRVTLSR